MPVLRDLGTAQCHQHRDRPTGEEYRRGQGFLELASASDDSRAFCAFAGTWEGLDDGPTRDLCRRAFELDPADPYPLGNYLGLEFKRDQPAEVRLSRSASSDDVTSQVDATTHRPERHCGLRAAGVRRGSRHPEMRAASVLS